MPTKKEMSETLNEVLDMDIQWDNLLKDDLREVVELFSEPNKLYNRLGAVANESSSTTDIAKELIKNWEGPVLSNVREATSRVKEATDRFRRIRKKLAEELEK